MNAPRRSNPGVVDSLVALLRRAPKGPSIVGATPHVVAWAENKWRLLRFVPARRRFARPILLVPSLINRWYVLDLGTGRSLIEWLVAQGHEVFCIDWGTPEDEDRYLTWDDIGGRYLGRAIRVAARLGESGDVHVLGYCLGGTLVAAYVASVSSLANPAKHGLAAPIASLTALAAPIDFDHAGIMATWTRSNTFDVRAIVEAFGNVPWPLMQASFHMLRPTLRAAKVVGLLDRAWDDEFLESFLATEQWGHDNVSFPGECYASYIEELYRGNRLVSGEFAVEGRRADLGAIRCPVLAIGFEDDHIVPLASAAPLIERVASRDKYLMPLRGGHVGAVVSRKAAGRLWPALSTFWADRDA
jgi:polyhydroxyalkanoate synthase